MYLKGFDVHEQTEEEFVNFSKERKNSWWKFWCKTHKIKRFNSLTFYKKNNCRFFSNTNVLKDTQC